MKTNIFCLLFTFLLISAIKTQEEYESNTGSMEDHSNDHSTDQSTEQQQGPGMFASIGSLFKNILHKGEEQLSKNGLELKLKEMSVEELRHLAVSLETYLLKGKEQATEAMREIEKGHLIDYLKERIKSNPELITKMILQLIDHFFVGLGIEEQDESMKVQESSCDSKKEEEKEDEHEYNPIYIGGGIGDYLIGMKRDKLIKIALALEIYSKKKEGREREKGGIHDYIRNLSDHDIRNYILPIVNKYPEINDIHRLQELVGEKLVGRDSYGEETGYNMEEGIADYLEYDKDLSEGVEEYLYSLNREELIKHAYACEKFHKEKLGIAHFLGGIHDYIFRLSDDEIRHYIINEVKEHYELNKLNIIKNICTIMSEEPHHAHSSSTELAFLADIN